MFCCYFWKTYCDKLIFRIRINTWQMFFSFSPLAAGIEGNGWLEFFICGCSYKIDFEASGNIWESEELCLQRWYSGGDQELGWTLAYVPIAISSRPENSAAALLFKLCCYARPRPCPPCLATLSLNWQLLATWATANTRRGKDVTLRQAYPHTTRAAQTWRKYSLQRKNLAPRGGAHVELGLVGHMEQHGMSSDG